MMQSGNGISEHQIFRGSISTSLAPRTRAVASYFSMVGAAEEDPKVPRPLGGPGSYSPKKN